MHKVSRLRKNKPVKEQYNLLLLTPNAVDDHLGLEASIPISTGRLAAHQITRE